MKDYSILEGSQSKLRGTQLSHSDRRVLLISSLTLFLRRARHGHPVTSEDLVRLASYGDVTDRPPVESTVKGAAA